MAISKTKAIAVKASQRGGDSADKPAKSSRKSSSSLKGSKKSLKTVLLFCALIPTLIAVFVVAFFLTKTAITELESSTRDTLNMATTALKRYYEVNLNEGIDLADDGFCKYNPEYIDSLKASGVEFTVFKGHIRFMTTILNFDGKRIEGTPANTNVWTEVSAGKTYFADGVMINEKPYYVCYMPLKKGPNVVDRKSTR